MNAPVSLQITDEHAVELAQVVGARAGLSPQEAVKLALIMWDVRQRTGKPHFAEFVGESQALVNDDAFELDDIYDPVTGLPK
jgi:hypothetical protein